MSPAEKLQRYLQRERLILRVVPELVQREDGTFGIAVKVSVEEEPKEAT